MRRLSLLCLAFVLTACAETSGTADKLVLEPAGFSELPGWNEDHQSEAIPALTRSCAVSEKSAKARQWQMACAALAQAPSHDDAAARGFFEHYFDVYSASGNAGEQGLFTGYYEPELRGSLHKTKRYRIPLHEHPRDLVTVDLGQFKTEWKGKHIAGKVTKTRLVPYDDRASIDKNSLQSRARVLVWVDDPVDAFFLEIQGSGRVRLPDGRILRVGYDGTNGRNYVAIGRVLADLNAVERPVTMQKIREWLAAHPDRAQETMNTNPSYVFFKELKGDGPVGAEAVALTPLRSLAVDPAFVGLGTPLWLDTNDANGDAIRRLMVAQDTGGAIKGAVRGDVFWGAGKQAEAEAGAMQSKGRYYLLLPKEEQADAGR